MTTAVAAPFRFFSLQVVRTRRLGPSFVRVTFAGDDLHAFRSLGRDQSLSLFLPHPGQTEPVVPVELGDGWWQGWRELPDDVRAVMRSYTLRALHRDAVGVTTGIDIDFALHSPPGPASRWAAHAAPGDRVLLIGPAVADNRAVRFRPPEDTGLVVMWGDDTAVPAATAILESLPPGTRVRAWLEVPHAGDIQDVPTRADAEITWLVRRDGTPAEADAANVDPADTDPLDVDPADADPVLAAGPTAAERPYVWLAGESGRVRALRRHFTGAGGIDRRRVTFVGYWRRGLTEEQLRAAE
ncbi:siderophore-interacting protein [Streptomyces sp. NPDC004065]|uniref:siderophore-interacting protein n=1 Tax=Streptomyces sp. NPDC004065 TaxID=3364689 RepID=UPI00384D4A50